jgi:beta-phosphoglucomutase-like phosphatase (HAD superfamily)
MAIIRKSIGHEFCGAYQALLFDCDGTLADTMPLHYEAWHQVLAPRGVVFARDRYLQLAGMPTREILGLLSSEQGIPLDFDELLPLKEGFFLKGIDRTLPIEPVVALARRFQGLMPLGVVSGGVRRAVERTLGTLAISTWFGAVVTAEDTLRGKPDPAPFLLCAERLGVEPGRCLVFEDAPLGFEAAERAGMDVVDIAALLTG